MSWPEAFALTVAIEVPLYVAGLLALRQARTGRALLAAFLANVVTHPALWWSLSGDVTMATVVVAEICVCVVEGVVVRLVTRREALVALLIAVGANAASFGVGLVISAFGA